LYSPNASKGGAKPVPLLTQQNTSTSFVSGQFNSLQTRVHQLTEVPKEIIGWEVCKHRFHRLRVVPRRCNSYYRETGIEPARVVLPDLNPLELAIQRNRKKISEGVRK
jgi:hypothetical protein